MTTIEGARKSPGGIQVAKPVAQPAAGPPAGPPRKPPLLKNVDREFLPAALEILTTPPSPVARSLLLAICALFVCALAWSYFGWIDIYATAPGKIQLRGGSRKAVAPAASGGMLLPPAVAAITATFSMFLTHTPTLQPPLAL